MPRFDRDSPDGLLIAAALTGEEQAFALLMRRYEAALFRVALSRLAQREIAEETVQETFLCAHRWLATYDSRFSFRTWLWTILLNQCSRQAKREARHTPAPPDRANFGYLPTTQAAAQHPSPLNHLLARENSEQIHALLARLPQAQADALRLRFFAGLTFPEIAATMQCSEPGAKHRVKTGLLKLGQWLQCEREQPAYRLEREPANQRPQGGLSAERGDVT
jgi:RNA polymerase sigma-70 factor, ECF subfamily